MHIELYYMISKCSANKNLTICTIYVYIRARLCVNWNLGTGRSVVGRSSFLRSKFIIDFSKKIFFA